MFSWTRIISMARGADAGALRRRLESAGAASAARRQLIAPTMQPGAGDLLWHLQFEDDDAYRACRASPVWQRDVEAVLSEPAVVASVDGAAYRPALGKAARPGIRNGIYRTLMLSIEDGTPAESVRDFDAEMSAMPEYIPTIRNWAYSHVVEAEGAGRWTRVWEQEFDGLSGLRVGYMNHPYHWGFIDRWYDPFNPRRIVAHRKCHSYCAFETSMIAPNLLKE